jgi:NADH-quinone oxidoreductase subunit G
MVYFDAPRCILCYRCVRVCDEGLGVNALGVVNRGVISEIAPNKGDHLDCDECGACIDICPVGALTSGTYRYQSRPWEMNHVGTICTHCSNGCKTTLSIRNGEIKRANNRDRSGINDEFLCVKGRFGYDFVGSEERLQSPMIRRDGVLAPASWSEALALVASKLAAAKEKGGTIAVSASTRTTNEDNYYLQKLLREGLGSNHIDHHRTGDVATLIDALAGKTEALATVGDLYTAKGALVVGADLAQQHPLLAFQLRANFRHHGAKVFTVTPGAVRERDYAAGSLVVEESRQMEAVESLRDSLAGLESVVIAFGSSVRGEDVRRLVAFGESLGGRVKYIPLVEYSNSRGALDMGLVPDLLPGYQPAGKPGMTLPQMLAATDLDVFWAVGSNPLEHADLAAQNAFLVVQDLFLTETAKKADVVLPAASAYEKSGTVTNTCGEVQRLKQGAKVIGVKPDLEIFGLLGKELGLQLGIWTADKVFEEIRRTVKGYNLALPVIATGGAAQTAPLNGRVAAIPSPDLIQPANDTLFTSGTLSRYSKMLNAPMEAPGQLYKP